MSVNTINTRIKCKYDTITNWAESSLKPLAGEICVAVLPNTSNNYDVGSAPDSTGLTPYAIGIKVGDGIRTFSQLPWIQAVAGDVYAWAKAATKPSYSASEITNLDSYISSHVTDTDTLYRIIAGTGADTGKYFLQSKAKSDPDTSYTTVSTMDLTGYQTALTFDGTYNASTNKVATESTVSGAIGALGTAANGTIATSPITDSDTSTDLVTRAQVSTYVASKTAGLTGAMHFIGTATVPITDGSTTDPEISGYTTKTAGDVVLYGAKEFVWNGSAWEELGNEGSYALSTVTISGSNGLTGGGDLSTNRTISHASRPASSTTPDATFGSSSNKYLKQVKVDAYGHVIKVEEDNITTYKFGTGSADGTISVTPVSGGVDGTAADVTVKGLKDGAFKDVASSIDFNSNTNDGKVPTIGAVKGAINGLDSSVSATAASGNVYSVLTGVTQADGKLSSKTEVTLAAIAKTGSIYDTIESNTVTENSATVNFLIFD